MADGVERGVAEDDAAVAGPHGRRGVGDGRHGDDDGGGGGDVGGAHDDAVAAPRMRAIRAVCMCVEGM